MAQPLVRKTSFLCSFQREPRPICLNQFGSPWSVPTFDDIPIYVLISESSRQQLDLSRAFSSNLESLHLFDDMPACDSEPSRVRPDSDTGEPCVKCVTNLQPRPKLQLGCVTFLFRATIGSPGSDTLLSMLRPACDAHF